jgi:hypothetical protein
LPLLNKQLDRLNYVTMGDLVKDLITGKLTHVTEDQQIDVMKTNLRTIGRITGISGKPFDLYKQNELGYFKQSKDLVTIILENTITWKSPS